jgi:hypothetical protein
MVGKSNANPMKRWEAMHLALRCAATSKRTGCRCRAPVERAKRVCRFHGTRAGAPKGQANGAYRHGRRSAEAIAKRRAFAALLREARTTVAKFRG